MEVKFFTPLFLLFAFISSFAQQRVVAECTVTYSIAGEENATNKETLETL